MVLSPVLKSLNIRLFFKTFKIDIFSKMSTYHNVYVRHFEAEDTMKINFTFGTPEFPDRIFTFMRSKEEKLETTLARMKLKILDTMTKKLLKKKKRGVQDTTEINHLLPQICISLSKGNEQIDCNLRNIEAWTSGTELKLNENVYRIIQNPPSVLHISLPKNIMAGFPVYPKITLEFCANDECNFTWYRLLSKGNKINYGSEVIKLKGESWLRLADNLFYITKEDDVGCKLKISCQPKCGDKTGIDEYAVSPNVVQFGPKRCPFEDRHDYTKELAKPGSVRCVSYNILADLYADSETARNDLFPYCPTEALSIDYRKQLYLKEIIGYNGDVICLQEVDRKIFHGDLVPILSSVGLEAIYSEKGGQVGEGLSCFYRTSKFKLIESHAIILSDAIKTEPVLQQMLSKVVENEKLRERLMNRTTAFQVVLLESTVVPKRRILIGNTHLYFHPESDNIRLIQGACFILYLESLLIKCRQENPSYTTSIILSGDFNSDPECGVYELMTKGNLSENCQDWSSNPEELVPGLPLKHSLMLGSACGTPNYTNYTEGFVGCLDYIFYDKSTLKLSDVVPFPRHEQVIENRALPSELFPSDHIALVCTLDWN